MNNHVIETMSPEIYQKLKTAVELGKWENGQRLTPQQLESALQATLLYAAINDLGKDELFTISSDGEILTGSEAKKSYRARRLNESISIEIQKHQ
ncbi:MAG: hypothetical protein COW84_04695 [Gammaproteobacteria bacterium CG22_combo_CG10-13_8_21_14_all_40_8]|nr:MAG: hypothetical protein COW84_04695 [Gammaproteobacteria bacterium CG22_combo_CG10-13_8_21_14_all_40_8]